MGNDLSKEIQELVKLARNSEKRDDFVSAFDAWKKLAAGTGRADYLCKLGSVSMKLGRWVDAEKAFLDAIESDKTVWLAMVLLGSLFLKRTDGNVQANAQKAKEWLERALSVSPNPATLSLLGDTHNRLGEKEAAKMAFRKVIELDDTYAEAYFNLGLLLSADGQAIEAEELLRKAAQLDPDSYRAHGALGVLLEELGHYDEAEAELKRTLELNPSDSIARNHLRRLRDDPGRK